MIRCSERERIIDLLTHLASDMVTCFGKLEKVSRRRDFDSTTPAAVSFLWPPKATKWYYKLSAERRYGTFSVIFFVRFPSSVFVE